MNEESYCSFHGTCIINLFFIQLRDVMTLETPWDSRLLRSRFPPLLQLLITDVSQLIHLRCLSRRNTFRKLHKPTHRRPSRNGILRGLRIHLNHHDTWVLGPTVVFAIAKITNPRFKCGGVVFLDYGAIGDEARAAGDRGPFAGIVKEGEIDV